jgi:hypothetical protein
MDLPEEPISCIHSAFPGEKTSLEIPSGNMLKSML